MNVPGCCSDCGALWRLLAAVARHVAEDLAAARKEILTALRSEQPEVGFVALQYDDQIGKLAVVGAGMRTSAGVSAQLFRALSDAGINIEMISTSEIKISVVVNLAKGEAAVRTLHTAFIG